MRGRSRRIKRVRCLIGTVPSEVPQPPYAKLLCGAKAFAAREADRIVHAPARGWTGSRRQAPDGAAQDALRGRALELVDVTEGPLRPLPWYGRRLEARG